MCLLEIHYRMAVAYLAIVWKKSSKELTNLFAGMKEMECNRRFHGCECECVISCYAVVVDAVIG